MAKNNNGINSRMLTSGIRVVLDILSKTMVRQVAKNAILSAKHSFKTYGDSNEAVLKRLEFVHEKLCESSCDGLFEHDVVVLKALHVEISAYIETIKEHDTDITCSEEVDEFLRLSLSENIKNLEKASNRKIARNILQCIMQFIEEGSQQEKSMKIYKRAKFTDEIIGKSSCNYLFNSDIVLLKILIAEFNEYVEYRKSQRYTENTALKKSSYTPKNIRVFKEENNSTRSSNRGLAVLKIVAQILGGAVLEVLLQHFLGF